jgi:hypothetical protein
MLDVGIVFIKNPRMWHPINTASLVVLIFTLCEPLVIADTPLSADANGNLTPTSFSGHPLNLPGDTNMGNVSIQTSLDAKEPAITAGSAGQYWDGTKTWQTLNSAAVGLGNLTNDAQVKRTEMGAANGVATLDSSTKLPTAQLPTVAARTDTAQTFTQPQTLPLIDKGGQLFNSAAYSTVQAAVDAPVGSDGGPAFVPRGTTNLTSTVNIPRSRSSVLGAGPNISYLYFNPSSAGTAALSFSGGGTGAHIYNSDVRDISITGQGSQQKIALDIKDASNPVVWNVAMNNLADGLGSIGLMIEGRELGSIMNLDITADLPISIKPNPNNNLSLDHFHFWNLVLHPDPAQPNVLIDPAANLTNNVFDGVAAVHGKNAFYWSTSGSPPLSYANKFTNIRHETSTDDREYTLYLNHYAVGTTVDNYVSPSTGGSIVSGGGTGVARGFYLRKQGFFTIRDFFFPNPNSAEALNIGDPSNHDIEMWNSYILNGSTFNTTGMDMVIGRKSSYTHNWTDAIWDVSPDRSLGGSDPNPADGWWIMGNRIEKNVWTTPDVTSAYNIFTDLLPDNTVGGSLAADASAFSLKTNFTKNDSTNGTMSQLLLVPNINFGGSNTNGTIDVIKIFTVTPATTGLGTLNFVDFWDSGSQKFRVSNGGSIAMNGSVQNLSTGNNATINPSTTGTSITRNVADANPALIVQQTNASSTGDIVQFKNSSVTAMKVAQNGTTTIGSSGSAIKMVKSATATLDFGSTAAQSSSELTITLTGALDGDDIIVSPPNGSSNANTCFTARVSAADTVTVKFNNYSAGAVDPASGTFRVTDVQF